MARWTTIDDAEREPDYEEALARYVAAHPESPDAGLVRALDAPARPADVANITVRPAGAGTDPAPTSGPPPRRIVGPTLRLGPGGSIGTYDGPMPDEGPAYSTLFPPSQPVGGVMDAMHANAERKATAMRAAANLEPPEPTPEGEEMFAALSAAAKAGQPGLMDRASDAAARAFTAPGLLQAWRGEPVTDPTPLQRLTGAVDDLRNPLPDASMPLPGEAPPANVPELEPKPAKPTPRVQVGHAAPVIVNNRALVESRGLGPPGQDPRNATGPAAPSVQVAISNTRAAPDTAEPSELDRALSAAAGRRLVAGLSRAGGTMIGRGSGAGYDNLDAEADRPIQELQLREAEADKGRARASAATEADPSSPQSVAARAAMARMVPELAKQPGWERQSAATLGKMFPWVKEIATLEMAKAEKEAARIAAASQKEADRENRLDVARIVHAGMGATRQAALEDRRDRQRETYVEKASKDAEGASELSDALDRVEARIKKAGPNGSMPGVGRVTGRLAAAGMFSSDEDVQMRADLQRMADIILKARSGSAVTPSEMERAQIETGTAPGASTQQVRVAAAAAVQTLRRAQQNLKAKYPGDTWNTIRERGGWTPGDRPAATDAGASGPPQISTVEEYNALPSGTQYIDPNGKPKVKR